MSADIISLAAWKSSKEQTNSRKLAKGLIAPAIEDTSYELAREHTADAIKSLEDIDRIVQWYIAHGRYRDQMLFIVGINFGLRVSDLVKLRFDRIINPDGSFKERFAILEQKTSTTRKVQRNRYVSINDAVVEAVTLYLEHTPGVCLSDYMFRSESNHKKGANEPLDTYSVERILKAARNGLGLKEHIATHTMRKTFGYHQMAMSGNSPRKLMLLQKMFGHSSAAQTMDYIGISDDEIEEAYMRLNLGSRKHYLVDSRLTEEVI